MSSQDDQSVLWYGLSGVSFNPNNPADVMLNSAITAPLLSDHPRALITQQITPNTLNPHLSGGINIQDGAATQQHQTLYEHHPEYIVGDYTYESYESFDNENINVNSYNSPADVNQSFAVEDENSIPKTKKPKVHQNPALKLKTPIAYQKDTDMDAIPIMREGMAVCKKCGAIGVKHAFYGKERQYCSLSCARPSNSCARTPIDIAKIIRKVTLENQAESKSGLVGHTNSIENGEETADLPALDGCESPSTAVNGAGDASADGDGAFDVEHLTMLVEKTAQIRSSSKTADPPSKTYDWAPHLRRDGFLAAPVTLFRRAPMNECWNQISVGMKLEVSCGPESLTGDAFWVASVILLCGYKAKLRFEGFVDDSSKDFWVDLCSEEVHPVGWCATQGKPLIPPKTIQNKYKDWKEFLMRRLTGARTLPTHFFTKVTESLKSRFSLGMQVEVVDKNRIAQMRIATVTEIVGKRLHLHYHGAPDEDNGFWCHEESTIMHPVGWSREVGHDIVAGPDYHEKCSNLHFDSTDAPPALFAQPTPVSAEGHQFTPGLKLEAVDPLNMSTICVATVMKVLEDDYLMIRIDSYDCDTTWSDWFCYHASSGCIFPPGFCQSQEISLTPPKGYSEDFEWHRYLADTKSIAAPNHLFPNIQKPLSHGFVSGMWLEATDLMDPYLVCVAMVREVKGRLLRIHFEGWQSNFDQWLDCQSPDIYPVGWCSLVGHKLEGPPQPASASASSRGKKPRHKNSRGGHHPFAPKNVLASSNSEGSILSNPPINTGSQRRGRKPRLRGSYWNQNNRSLHQPSSDHRPISEIKSNNGVSRNGSEPVYRGGRRGRPPRCYQPLSAPDARSSHLAATKAKLSSHLSEDEVSDESSSGVASLAGSESSFDGWDNETSVFGESNNKSTANLEKLQRMVSSPASLGVSDNSLKQVAPDVGLGSFEGHIDVISNPPDANPSNYIVTPKLDVSFSEAPPISKSLSKAPPINQNLPKAPPIRQRMPTFVGHTPPRPPRLVQCLPKPTPIASANPTQPIYIGNNSMTTPISNSDLRVVPSPIYSNHQVTQNAAIANNPMNISYMRPTEEFDTGLRHSTMSYNQEASQTHHLGGLNQSDGSLSAQDFCDELNNLDSQVVSDDLTRTSPDQTEDDDDLYIPRIIDGAVGALKGVEIKPKEWTSEHVCKFLRMNDCNAYCHVFEQNKVSGPQLLQLSQSDVLGMTGMKVGPSLKINDLIQQLLALVSPAQARYQATMLKRASLSFGKN